LLSQVADGKKQAQADAAMDRKAMAEAKKFAQQEAAAERKAQAQVRLAIYRILDTLTLSDIQMVT
jgi:hypothetical protein